MTLAEFLPPRITSEEAKRRIVELHKPTVHPVLPPECEWCGPDNALDLDEQWPCLHLKLLALWKP